MGRRTSKKNKEIIGMDTDSIWYKRNSWWGKQMRKKSTKSVMKKVKEYNRSQKRIKIKFPSIRKKKKVVWNPIADDFKGSLFRKVKANSQVGELFTPIMEDYPREFERDVIMNVSDWHVGRHSLREVQQAAEEIRHCYRDQCTIWSELKTGDCAVCGSMLTNIFPDDYPDDWKFCCLCKRIAEVLTGSDGFIKHITEDRVEKVRKKITLVGE